MKYINFIVGAVAWVPYFVPIVIEGNRQGIVSNFFLRKNPKAYADPYFGDHLNQIQQVANNYNIKIHSIKKVINYPGLTFLMEADISGRSSKDYSTAGITHLNKSHLKVSFTFNADFIWQYHRYIKSVDYVVLPGKSYEEAYSKFSPKNVYLGSPKFDIKFNTNKIFKKYHLLPSNRHLLFFYPKTKWINTSAQLVGHVPKIKHLINAFKKMGFKVIIKSREKDRVTQSMGDYYFEETDLFPNSSLELLHICKLAVFFSSATIEECVMSSIPFIDFKVDHKFNRFGFLHHSSYSRIISNLSIPYQELHKHVNAITTKNNADCFTNMQKKHMFVNEDFSKKLLEHFREESDKKYNDAVKIYSEMKTLKDKHNEISKKRGENVNPILQKIDDELSKEKDKNKTNEGNH
jgi:hypothetical protein